MDEIGTIEAINNIHRPHHAHFTLPGADKPGDAVVVEWRAWGGMWMWHVLTWSSRTGMYEHVWNSREGFDVRYFSMDGTEVPAPE